MGTLLLIAALLFQLPAAPDRDLVGEGIQALDAGRYDAAVDVLRQAVLADPADDAAHFNLALAYSLLGRDADAIPEYKKVLELRPGVYEASINLGQSLLRSQDAAGAVPYLEQAHQQKPAEFRPAYYLAEALFDSGRPADAIEPYTAALVINADSAPAELGLARALQQTGRLPEAEAHYRKAASLDPQLKGFLLELAQLHEQRGDTASALNLYREFRGDPAVEERIGVLSLNAGDTEAAIASLESAVRDSPTAANRVALAQAYVARKDLTRAEALAALAVEAEPKDFQLRMFYARILRDQSKTAMAAKQFLTAVEIKPDAADAWSELAGMLILAEQFPAALSALDRARDLGVEALGHLFFRATTYDHLQARKEAVEYYQKFLEASRGQNPDQEFQARQRIRILERDLGKR